MADSSSLGAQIKQRFSALKALRSRHEQVWHDCYEYTFPLRAHGMQGDVVDAVRGQRDRARLLDSTGTDAARTLAAQIVSGMTPSNALWFGLDSGADDDAAKRWQDDTARAMWEAIHNADFDAAAIECAVDIVAAGWMALYIDDDPPDSGALQFRPWPLGSLYVASTRAGGPIDTVYRLIRLSAQQAVTTYGEDRLSKTVRDLAVARPDEMVDFVHGIYPRPDARPGAQISTELPIASCVVELATANVVRESGYHEMPVLVPRWAVIPESPYGVGPVYDALPDIRMLQELKAMHLAHRELDIAPPYVVVDDGVLNPGALKVIRPRDVIVAAARDSIGPLLSGSNWQMAYEEVAALQRGIRRMLMADQLQPQDGPQMTATEVHVRVQMVRQMLGPIYGRLQAEYLQPLITRVYGLMRRAGRLDAPPQSVLDAGEFSVRYVSPLARAQQIEEVVAIERLLATVGQAAAVMPAVLDVVDGDEAMRIIGRGLGVPTAVLRDAEAVQQLRDERAQAQEQAQEQAMQQQQAAQTQQVVTEAAMSRAMGV